MLANLPLLISNQTLYSWCSLVYKINGHNTAFRTSLELFGSRYAALCHDFPSHLSTFEQRTNRSAGETTEIALHNTMLGYYLAIAKKQASETIQKSLYMGSIPSLKMQLGITASRIGGSHPLKACSDCISEDIRKYGYPYWHVEHQPPSVFICVRHSKLLKYVNDKSTPVHKRNWQYPENIPGSKWIEFNIPNIANNIPILTRLAHDTTQLMNYAPSSLDPNKLKIGYRSTLHKYGYIKTNGSLNIELLVQNISCYYKGLVSLPGMAFLKSINTLTPGIFESLCRRTERTTHPLKHLLLIGRLSESLVDFYANCQDMDIINHKISNPKPSEDISKNKLDEKFINLIQAQGLSISGASREMGISTTTGTQLAKSLNIYFTPRTKYLDYRFVKNILKQLNKGLPISLIATDIKTSESSVRRVLAINSATIKRRADMQFSKDMNCARKSFRTDCKKHSNLTLKQIRTLKGNSYIWLYRNDREWLNTTLRLFGRSRHFTRNCTN